MKEKDRIDVAIAEAASQLRAQEDASFYLVEPPPFFGLQRADGTWERDQGKALPLKAVIDKLTSGDMLLHYDGDVATVLLLHPDGDFEFVRRRVTPACEHVTYVVDRFRVSPDEYPPYYHMLVWCASCGVAGTIEHLTNEDLKSDERQTKPYRYEGESHIYWGEFCCDVQSVLERLESTERGKELLRDSLSGLSGIDEEDY